MSPWFLVIFFGIFQILGGAMLGRGARLVWSEPEAARGLVFGGIMFGIFPMLFDWFYFIQQGQLLYGLIGPALWGGSALLAALAGPGLVRRFDPKAVGAVVIGTAAALLGVFAIPFFMEQLKGRDIGSMDYVFAGCWVFMFVVIGSGTALAGLRALVHERTFDEEAAVSQPTLQKHAQKLKRKFPKRDKGGQDDSLSDVR